MAEIELIPGAALGDARYTLKRRIGAGGMAAVWLAEDERLSRQVAVKVIADALAADHRYRERFEREARAAASVSHPNIVPVYDYGLQAGHPFLVMEYVAGGNLADVLAGDGTVVPDPAVLARELLDALDCVHSAGLVHRDVKPANILLDPNGRARLSDFGIAQPEDAASLTQTGMVIGTLRYLAPEVIAGGRASSAADLYAAGVVLRELARRNPGSELSPVIEALTRADPDDRPACAAAALALLGAAEVIPGTAPTAAIPSTAPTRATPRSPLTREAPAVSRVRAQAAFALAGAAILVLILLISWSGGGRPRTAPKAVAAPALSPAGAPLNDQLSSLRRFVDRAAKP